MTPSKTAFLGPSRLIAQTANTAETAHRNAGSVVKSVVDARLLAVLSESVLPAALAQSIRHRQITLSYRIVANVLSDGVPATPSWVAMQRL